MKPVKKCKMDPKQKALWVNALLSGAYSQGKGALKIEEADGSIKYCCLGVAVCAIAGRNPGLLPFLSPGRYRLSLDLQRALAATNDSRRAGNIKLYKKAGFTTKPKSSSFKDIAEWIKKNL